MTSGYLRHGSRQFYHGVPLDDPRAVNVRRHVTRAIGGMTTEPEHTSTMAWLNWAAYLNGQLALIPALQEDVRVWHDRS